MSEFFFDYKCVALGNAVDGRNDRALDFYLYQDYEQSVSTMCAQIYIPIEMQEKFDHAKVYFKRNAVDFPDITSDCDCETWYSKREGHSTDSKFIHDNNSIFIVGENDELSGCGIIAFVEGKTDTKPKEENCYRFAINYTKKEIISYRVLESKGVLKIQIIYPLIRNKLVLNVVQKRGAKPVLVADRINKNAFTADTGQTMEIELVPRGRIQNSCVHRFKVEDVGSYDFRLAFANPDDNKHYLLVDESDYTYEDKKHRKDDMKMADKIVQNEPKCPYCGKPIVPLSEKIKKGQTIIVGEDGKPILVHTNDENLKGKVTRVCRTNLIEESKEGIKSYINVENLIVPDGYEKKPSMHVVVAGFTKSGKTIYLSSLFNMQDLGSQLGIKSRPFVLENVVKCFSKGAKNICVDEIKYYNVEGLGSDKVERGDLCERDRYNIKERYVMTVGNSVEAQTNQNEATKLSWYPVGYRLGNLGHAFFYDVPGELFTRAALAKKTRAVDMADCIIAVINGAKEIENPVVEVFETLQRFKDLANTKAVDMKNMPIAIVFTKHDLKLTDYVFDGDKGDCFDENCHVVREDILGMLPKNGVYEGSALERHIDCSSYEIEHYLKAKDSQSYENLKKHYKNIKFFTCSSLGSDVCLDIATTKNKKKVLFKPRRLRVELPLVWLMYKKGLIKR